MKNQKYIMGLSLAFLLCLSMILTSGFITEDHNLNEETVSDVSFSGSDEVNQGAYQLSTSDTIVSIGEVLLPVGGNGDVSFSIADVTELGSFNIHINWDPLVINITNIVDVGDFVLIPNLNHHLGTGVLIGYSTSDDGVSGSFDVADLLITAVGDGGDFCPIQITFCELFSADNASPTPIPFSIDHGYAEIIDESHPDIDVMKTVKETAGGIPYHYLFAGLGDVVYYNITVENSGDIPLDLSIKDEIHEGLDILIDVGETYHSNGIYYWNISNVQPGHHVYIQFPVKIHMDACGIIENTVQVKGFDECEQVVMKSDTAILDVECSTLSISKTVKENCCGPYGENISVDYGQYVTYKLDFYTDMALWSLSIRDDLPSLPGLLYDNFYVQDGSGNYIPPSEYTFTITNKYLFWNFSLIDPGTHLFIYYCADTVGCGFYTNTVNVTARENPCCDVLYVEDSAVVNVICPSGLVIKKEASLDGVSWYDAGVEGIIGDIVWFKITVRNLDFDGPIYAVNVTDTLPDHLAFVGFVSTDGGSVISGSGWWQVFYTFIGASDSKVIIFKARVMTSGDHRNVAIASSCGEEGVEDDAWVNVTHGMSIRKTVSDDNESWVENITVVGGERVWWNVSVHFASEDINLTLVHIVITDWLPQGVTYVNDSGIILKHDGWSLMREPVKNNRLLTWDLSLIPECYLRSGDWLSVILATDVDATVNGTLVNWGNVSARQCDGTDLFEKDDARIHVNASINHPPVLSNPEPIDDAINVSKDVSLKITVSDVDDDTLTVVFYNASDDSVIDTFTNVNPTKTLTADWDDLEYNTTYQWYVTVSDGTVTITSDVWSFTTMEEPDNSPPNDPTNPNPANNAAGVIRNPTLSVYVSDPDNDQLTVKFYDKNTNHLIGTDTCSNACTASVTWSGLAYQTTYRWYVVVSDGEFEVVSDTWSFTTISLNIDLNLNLEGGLGLTLAIDNSGTDPASGVSWSIHVANEGFINRINKTESGTESEISAGSVVYEKMSVFGIGRVEITATASCTGATPVTLVKNAFLIGPIVLLR